MRSEREVASQRADVAAKRGDASAPMRPRPDGQRRRRDRSCSPCPLRHNPSAQAISLLGIIPVIAGASLTMAETQAPAHGVLGAGAAAAVVLTLIDTGVGPATVVGGGIMVALVGAGVAWRLSVKSLAAPRPAGLQRPRLAAAGASRRFGPRDADWPGAPRRRPPARCLLDSRCGRPRAARRGQRSCRVDQWPHALRGAG